MKEQLAPQWLFRWKIYDSPLQVQKSKDIKYIKKILTLVLRCIQQHQHQFCDCAGSESTLPPSPF